MGSEAWTSIRYSRRGVDIMLCNMEFGKWCGTGYLYGPEFILSPTSDPRLISFVRLSFWSRASIDSFPFFPPPPSFFFSISWLKIIVAFDFSCYFHQISREKNHIFVQYITSFKSVYNLFEDNRIFYGSSRNWIF